MALAMFSKASALMRHAPRVNEIFRAAGDLRMLITLAV
jgi:hypothetical protein